MSGLFGDDTGAFRGVMVAVTESVPRWVRTLGLVILPLAAVTVFLVGFHSIINEDFWWHVKAGSDIVSGEGIPRVDTYSYPSEGRPYVDLHWLFQILIHLLYKAGGESGVIWIKCLLTVGIFAILFSLARTRAPAPLAAVVTAIGAIVASERILARPELLSFLFLALTIWLIRRHEEGSRRAWIALPLVTLVWVNCEGLFVLGFVLVGAHLLGRLRDRRLWLALALSVVASLINPFFVTGAVHPFVLFTRINGSLEIYSMTIGEFLSPFDGTVQHPAVAIFPYYLALIGVALILHGRRPKVSEIVLLVAFGYLAISARRNLALLAIVATPIIARWIGEGVRHSWPASVWRSVPVAARTALAVIAGLGVVLSLAGYCLGLRSGMIYNASQTNRKFGTAQADVAFPREAAAFLKENRIKGPIFNLLASGGYLIHAYPEEKVFIDGRLEVHATEHYGRYLTLGAGGQAWKDAEEEFGFRCLILNYALVVPLLVERLGDLSWEPVFVDDTAIVFIKPAPELSDFIERHRITPNRLRAGHRSVTPQDVASVPAVSSGPAILGLFRSETFPWGEIYLGQLFDLIGIPELSAYQYVQATKIAPHLLRPRLLLARALDRVGEREQFMQVMEGMKPLHPVPPADETPRETLNRLLGG